MIHKLEVTGVHMTVGDDLRKYVTRKIANLDRYVPRALRESIHADIKLKESNARDKNERTCEVVLHVPHETITVKESTINIYAAVDIAEEKLKNQLKKYKDLHGPRAFHRRVLSRLKHRAV